MATGLLPIRSLLGGLFALGVVCLAWFAWDDARYAYGRAVNAVPARSDDSVALARRLDLWLQKRPDSRISGADIDSLKNALAQAPLSRVALRIVGLQAEMAGDLKRAAAAVMLSNRISRRDALTQLWLIERSVGNDDMTNAIRHYNAALSAHPELEGALLPILAKAIAYAEVRTALVPYVARHARWSTGFLDTASRVGNPKDAAQLILLVADTVPSGKYDDINARVITRLSEAGDFDTAYKLARVLVADAKGASLSSLGVTDTSTDRRLGVLAWAPTTDGRILTAANGRGGFDFDIEPLFFGLAASRTIAVSGGQTYSLSQTLRGNETGAADMTWQASCVPSKAKVWEQRFPKPRGIKRYQSTIAVPADCKGLKFDINFRGPDGSQPAHIAMEMLDFRPHLN